MSKQAGAAAPGERVVKRASSIGLIFVVVIALSGCDGTAAETTAETTDSALVGAQGGYDDSTVQRVKDYLERDVPDLFELRVLGYMEMSLIRQSVRQIVDDTIGDLSRIAQADEDAPLPIKYHYLIPASLYRYWLANEDVPEQWTVMTFLKGFRDRQDAFKAIETRLAEIALLDALKSYYRERDRDLE